MKTRKLYFVLACLFCMGLVLSACIDLDESDQPAATAAPPAETTTARTTIPATPDGITVEALKSATYSGIEMVEEPITLSDGSYVGDPDILTVEYMENSARFGDLDGDGVEDAVVVLMERGGGTNTNYYLAAQLNDAGEPADAGAVLVDGNIQIMDLAIQEGQVMLDVTTRGPGDANCCASYRTQRTFALQEGTLAGVGEPTEPVRVSAADLNGTSWTLLEFEEGQPALDEPAVTLSFEGGSLTGSGGCNTYNTNFSLSEENPFALTIGPIAATSMACPDPIQEQETAYFAALSNASQWSYLLDDLAIYYVEEGELPKRLLFAAADMDEAGMTEAELETPEMTEDASEPSLVGQSWQWVGFTSPVEQVTIEMPENYTVTFLDDGSMSITADCNQANLGYSDEEGSLTVEPGPMTLALCGPDSRSEQFVGYLSNAARYFFQDGHLFIDLFADGGTLEFRP